MGVPSWLDPEDGGDVDAWDRLEIGGVVFQDTVVEIEGTIENEWDVAKAAGNDGAPAKNKGYAVMRPKVSWTLYNEDHFELYQQLLANIQPKPGKKSAPIVEVVHPQLQLMGKGKFNVEKIHTLKKVGPRMMQAQVELIEYFPAPKPAPKPAPVPAPPERERAYQELETFKPSNNPVPGEFGGPSSLPS